jgi:hypothetical protein
MHLQEVAVTQGTTENFLLAQKGLDASEISQFIATAPLNVGSQWVGGATSSKIN